jgi:hypothetical protein
MLGLYQVPSDVRWGGPPMMPPSIDRIAELASLRSEWISRAESGLIALRSR